MPEQRKAVTNYVVTVLLSLFIAVISGLLLDVFRERAPDLTYVIASSGDFVGQVERIGIAVITISNPGRKEAEDVRCKLNVSTAFVKEYKITGLSMANAEIQQTGHTLELKLPYLNPHESFTVQLLLTPEAGGTAVPEIQLRGKGIVGHQEHPTRAGESVTDWSKLLVTAVAAILSIISLLYLRGKKNRRPSGLVEWDAVADFSIAANPSGPWSYGYRNGRERQVVPHTSSQIENRPGVDRWASPQIEPNMGVMHNRTGRVVMGDPPTYTIPPDMLHMHPGEGGIYDVVRWTCPLRGQFAIQGRFSGLDTKTSIADSDVDIVINSITSLFKTKAPAVVLVLHGAGTQIPITFTDIRLSAGDTVDFIVGVGPSGKHFNDSTGLQARISQTRS